MRKQYLVITLSLCLIAGMLRANAPVFGDNFFPECSLTVTVKPSDTTICLGSSVNLTATASNGSAPYTYAWLPTAGLNNPSVATPVATPTVSTNYTVTVTDSKGCTATASVDITVNDPPTVNADTLLMQYLTGQPLSATGGVAPYTYAFSPAISSSSLVALLTSTVTTTYTMTVTGANGCASAYTATYVPLTNEKNGACKTIFMSEYIQDTLDNDDGIELYNPTSGSINLSSYYLTGTTKGSLDSVPFFIALHGAIAAHKTFLIANTHADTSLTHKASMLSDSLNFGGKDIVALAHIVVNPPNVTCSFLDMVGAISPLPTDSGWAVSSGSTKNHTLVRETTVTEGDMNWATCKSEWNVYPRGTFTYIGEYENVCTPKDPYLYLSFGDTSVTCGDPGWFNFDVMVQADSAKIFNDGIFDFIYTGGEFAGDNLSDGSVKYTQDSNFAYIAGENDYNFLAVRNSGNSFYVQFGDASGFSPFGTVIDTIPKAIFHFSLKIQNSCESGTVYFDSTTWYNWQYVNEDTTYSHLDSTKSSYTTCCQYQCGDTLGPPYICGWYCCNIADTNVGGICLDTCWDTCTTYPVYCYDTTWSYTYDSVYSYSNYSNKDYSEPIIYSGSQDASGCSMSISGYTNPINAGTNAKSVPPVPDIPDNSSILTITGAGFGSQKDSIRVSNANAYGMVRLDTLDILSWSENLIKVKMPSVIFNNLSATPGSGPFTVYNSCGDSATDTLQINYNIENNYFGDEKYRPTIVMASDTASITFRCDTSISHNPGAYACVKKAIRAWNCATGVNWKLGDTIIRDTIQNDNISLIYFANNDNFRNNFTIMETFPWYLCRNSSDSMTFCDESDTKIKRNQYLPYDLTWSYDTTATILPDSVLPFYDAILHELGHAHGLGHINDLSSLMYRITRTGYYRLGIDSGSTYPGPGSLLGGWDMVKTSAAYSPRYCSDSILIPLSIACPDPTANVSVVSENNPYSLNLYPNPINWGDITIAYSLSTNSSVQFKITDCTGRILVTLPEEQKTAGEYNESINVSKLAQGVYLFTANVNGELETIKFIKI